MKADDSVVVVTGPTTDVEFLRKARRLGDKLVMVLNGKHEDPRVYARLADQVIVLGCDTPRSEMLARMSPEIYAPERPDEEGSRIVRERGGLVVLLEVTLPLVTAGDLVHT